MEKTLLTTSVALKDSINSLIKDLMMDAIKMDIGFLSAFDEPMIVKYIGSAGKVVNILLDYSDSLAYDLARKDEQIDYLKAMLQDAKNRENDMKNQLADIKNMMADIAKFQKESKSNNEKKEDKRHE